MASTTRTRDHAERTTQQTRRRFARRQWARRWLRWKPVVALVVVLALSVAGVYTVYFSDALAVDGVEVAGNSTLSDERIREAADVEIGEPLARVDVDKIMSRVGSLADVESVDVSRAWPHEVLVTVVERTPVAVLEIAGSLRGLDAAGVVFGTFQPAPPGLPRIQTTSSTSADALREAARVVSALPEELAATVDHVEVETVDRITLVLRDDRVVRWGSAAQSEEKAAVLEALLGQDAREYDISVPGTPTTTP